MKKATIMGMSSIKIIEIDIEGGTFGRTFRVLTADIWWELASTNWYICAVLKPIATNTLSAR